MTQRPAIHFRSAGSRYQGIKTFKSIKTTNKSFRPAHTSPKLAGSNKGLTPQQLKSGKITTGPTGKLAHATFAPKHAFNAVGGDWWRFRRRFVPGFFFGWVGPVFWPFFYVDLFEYTFWPFYYADYFWAYPYDEIFETIYFIETVPVGPGRGRAPVSPAVTEQRIAQICGEQARGLTEWPFARIEKGIDLNDAQRSALAQMKEAAAKGQAALEASCPREVPTTPTGRLEIMRLRLEAMLEALRIVRPALENFYASLNEEQKARFNSLGPRVAENRAGRRETQSDMTRACEEPKPALVDMPVDRITRAINPTEAQQAKLDALKQASAQAVEKLRANCPNYTALTPTGRLEIMEKRLGAMIDAVRLVQPPLDDFYQSLSDEQKRRLNAVSRSES